MSDMYLIFLTLLCANVVHARHVPTSLLAAVEPCTGKLIRNDKLISELN